MAPGAAGCAFDALTGGTTVMSSAFSGCGLSLLQQPAQGRCFSQEKQKITKQ